MEYVSEGLPDLLAATDVMLSRAGANALSEILALHIPALLVPYPLSASRGDQVLNAKSFAKRGFSQVLEQEKLTADTLVEALAQLWQNRAEYRRTMEAEPLHDGTDRVIAMIEQAAQEKRK